MKKKTFVGAMAAESGVTRKKCEKAVNAFIASVSDAVTRKEKVTLRGFGTFSVVTRAAGTGRNLSTGAPIHIPAKDVPKFRPGTTLKNNVAGKERCPEEMEWG
jgi:DNA-binding protein HU-beta